MFGMKKEKKMEDYKFEDFQYMDLTPENVDIMYQRMKYVITERRNAIEEDGVTAIKVNIFGNVVNEKYPPVYFPRYCMDDEINKESIIFLFGQTQPIHLGKPAAPIDAMRDKFMGGPNGIVWADEAHTKELYELMYLGVGTGLIAPLKEITLRTGERAVGVDLTHAKAKEIYTCVSKETRERYSDIFGPEKN